jgi:uncharacterized protein (TIGR02145 family)
MMVLIFGGMEDKTMCNFFWSYQDLGIPPLANSKYGLLYNWYAATGGSFVAGWHLPTNAEIIALSTYLDAATNSSIYGTVSTSSGGYLKQTGTTYWNPPNTGATNSTGYTSRANGERLHSDGTFYAMGASSWYWSSSLYSSYPVRFNFSSADASFIRTSDYHKKGMGIRLICDSSTDPGYVDIDGKRYTTVKIGDQVWMAENLQARHYSDGTPIPFHGTDNGDNFTNAEWAALTTPGLCAYNNDISNE